MVTTTLRRASAALALAFALLAPSAVRANDQQQPPPGPAPQPLQPGPYQPPPGGGPPGSPPVYAPPPGGAPYAPPGYPAQPYGAPVLGPEEITEFDDSQPAPYGYTKVTRRRKGLIIGGAVTLGSVYLLTTLVAAVAEDINRADGSSASVAALYVPVVGPFFELGQTTSSTARFYLTLSGLSQTAGAIMLFYGLTSPRTVLVRNDQLSIAPLFGHGASGLSVIGRF